MGMGNGAEFLGQAVEVREAVADFQRSFERPLNLPITKLKILIVTTSVYKKRPCYIWIVTASFAQSPKSK